MENMGDLYRMRKGRIERNIGFKWVREIEGGRGKRNGTLCRMKRERK